MGTAYGRWSALALVSGNHDDMKVVLVTSDRIGEDNLRRLSRTARVYASWKMDERRIGALLPRVSVLVIFLWPRFLGARELSGMKRLEFLQSMLVGVNHSLFRSLGKDVVVASNAGAYSLEVGEHAWGLLLAAAKKIVQHQERIREGTKGLREFSGEAAGTMVLKGKTLGIIGYGGIGKVVGRYARALGMGVLAFARTKEEERQVEFLRGKKGLHTLLKRSDVVVLSLPLTDSTYRMIGRRELSLMKDDAILVNIARGDLVDQEALYSWLRGHPNFRNATDAWWFREGVETLEPGRRFARLPNFVGSPHMSGPTAVASGRPGRLATDNVLRYIRGGKPRHVVDRSEYSLSAD